MASTNIVQFNPDDPEQVALPTDVGDMLAFQLRKYLKDGHATARAARPSTGGGTVIP